MREKDLFPAINKNYGSVMSINNWGCEDARIEFVVTHINRCFLGHETGSHGYKISLPRCAGFGTNQYETRQRYRTRSFHSLYYCKTWLITICISRTYHLLDEC